MSYTVDFNITIRYHNMYVCVRVYMRVYARVCVFVCAFLQGKAEVTKISYEKARKELMASKLTQRFTTAFLSFQ